MKPTKRVMSDVVVRKNQTLKPISTDRFQKAKMVTEKNVEPIKEVLNQEARILHTKASQGRSRFGERDQTDNHQSKKMGCALWILVPLCLTALTLVLGGLISGARIEIKPIHWQGTINTNVTLTYSNAPYEAGNNSILFYTATKKFTETARVPAAKVVVIETRAEGTVRVYNTTAKAVTLPAGTELTVAHLVGPNTVSSIKYLTTKSVTVPKGTPEKPSQKDLVIQAVLPGTMYNTQPTDFVLMKPIEGIMIRGVTAISGGRSATDRSIDPALLASIKSEIASRFPENEVLIRRVVEDTPEHFIALPISFTTSEPKLTIRDVDDATAEVVLEKNVTVILVKKIDLARLLGTQIGVGKENMITLDTLDGLTMVTTALGSADAIPTRLPVRITGTATVRGALDTHEIVQKIAGKSKREAKIFFGSLPEIEYVDIHMIPFWRRILPLDATKISVTVLNP